MALNLQQKFLYLFADYRTVIDGKQKSDDELLFLRQECATLRSELKDAHADALARERENNDRLMRLRFGDKITQATGAVSEPHPVSEPIPIGNVKQWQQNQFAKFEEDFKKFVASPTSGPASTLEN